MVDCVEDIRISVEDLLKKIKPPDLVHAEGKKMVSLKKENGFKETKIKADPKPLPVAKKRLTM
jgi:hypothetical protein